MNTVNILPEIIKKEFIFEGNHIEIIGKTKRFTFKFRQDLFDFNHGRYKYCGEKIENANKMNIDHIIPKLKGGGDNIENLGCACSFCNKSKGIKDDSYLKFNIALRKRGLNKILTPSQARQLIAKGIDLNLCLEPFHYEVCK